MVYGGGNLSSPMQPKSKLAVKSARTRTRLIETTLELLPKYGFHRLSLDTIAKRAGVTKGAIYGHFGSKEQLLLAALGTRPESRPDRLPWPNIRGGTVRERLRRIGEEVLAQQKVSSSTAIAGVEFLHYALTHSEMKKLVGELALQSRKEMEKNILNLFSSEELPMPVESFALLLTSLISSLTYSLAFAEGGIRRETILALFEGLAGRSQELSGLHGNSL